MGFKPEGYLFEKEILVFGLKRSGMHAIINWIMGHYENKDDYFFQNDTDLSFYDRGKTGRISHIGKKLTPGIPKCYINLTEHLSIKELPGRLHQFNEIKNTHVAKMFSKMVFSQKEFRILCIRDPKNNYASLKSSGTGREKKESFVENWMEYAHTALPTKDMIVVIYDKWFTNIEYRKNISKQLELKFSDKNLNSIFRSGSSFNGFDFDGRAQQMDVLNRWKNYEGTSDMERIITETEFTWRQLCTTTK